MLGLRRAQEAINAADTITTTTPVHDSRQQHLNFTPATLPTYQTSAHLPELYAPSLFTTQRTRRSTFFATPAYDAFATPPDNLTAQAINDLSFRLSWQESERRHREDRAHIEAETRALHTPRAPLDGTIRFWARTSASLPTVELDRTLFFARTSAIRQPRVGEFVFPHDAYQVWETIKEFQTESQCRRYIKYIKDELEELIKHSPNLSRADQRKLLNALNTHDAKDGLRVASLILGVVIFAMLAPTCLALAAEATALQCAATSMLCLALTCAPWFVVEKLLPSMRYFPTNSGAVCEVRSFRAWITDLARVVAQIVPDLNAIDAALAAQRTQAHAQTQAPSEEANIPMAVFAEETERRTVVGVVCPPPPKPGASL